MAVAMPGDKEMAALVGEGLYDVWKGLCARIEADYDMDRLWNQGGKAWKYEYKYRRGGKTLCALYARENCVGFMVILGKEEREKFAAERETFTEQIRKAYDQARTYHDGKWIMFEPKDSALFDDFIRLLRLKRNPNRRGKTSGKEKELPLDK